MMSNHEVNEESRPKVSSHSNSFNYDLDFENINFKKRPTLYRIGKGDEGVLLVEPYKSEIACFWTIEDIAQATESSEKIFQIFLDYLEKNDFVGADMARKFLLMGFTRARRYAHHKKGSFKTGRKNKGATPKIKVLATEGKNQSAAEVSTQKPERSPEAQAKLTISKIFKAKSAEAKSHPKYQELKAKFIESINSQD